LYKLLECITEKLCFIVLKPVLNITSTFSFLHSLSQSFILKICVCQSDASKFQVVEQSQVISKSCHLWEDFIITLFDDNSKESANRFFDKAKPESTFAKGQARTSQ
jgi:hypothetical protein